MDVGGAVDGGQDAVAHDEDDAGSANTQHFLKSKSKKIVPQICFILQQFNLHSVEFY